MGPNYPRQDSNDTANHAGKQVIQPTGGAEMGALDPKIAPFPPELADLVAAWPTLPEATRAGILAMIRGAMK
jgi:hypothetical protein